jgi:hypothetical protein
VIVGRNMPPILQVTARNLKMSYPLDAYVRNVRGISFELGEILHYELDDAVQDLVRKKGEKVFEMNSDEAEAALKFLRKTPTQREKALARLDDPTAALLVLRARYLGLMGVKALDFAEKFQYLPGKGYRDAAEFCTREVLRFDPNPSLQEVLRHR